MPKLYREVLRKFKRRKSFYCGGSKRANGSKRKRNWLLGRRRYQCWRDEDVVVVDEGGEEEEEGAGAKEAEAILEEGQLEAKYKLETNNVGTNLELE
jgi:hypothetical protein